MNARFFFIDIDKQHGLSVLRCLETHDPDILPVRFILLAQQRHAALGRHSYHFSDCHDPGQF